MVYGSGNNYEDIASIAFCGLVGFYLIVDNFHEILLWVGNYAVVIILVIILLYVLSLVWKRLERRKIASDYERDLNREFSRSQNIPQKGFKKLHRLDSSFNLKIFEKQSKVVFSKIKTAWTNQDFTTIRQYVSDNMFQQLSTLHRINSENGLVNINSDINILGSQVSEITSDKHFDTITVRISAIYRSYYKKLKRRKTYGTKREQRFTEYWTFIRKHGVKTVPSGGLMAGICPNCSQPFKLNDKTECMSCGAMVYAGEYDWILSEITQSQFNYQLRRQHEVPLSEIQRNDPFFNTQTIEERVASTFWAIKEGEFINNYKYAKRFITKEFYHTLMGRRGGAEWSFSADPTIGAVDFLEYYPADDDEFDRIRVKLTASFHKEQRTKGERFIPDPDKSYTGFYEYILKRHKACKTLANTNLVTLHCPNCGAPEPKETTECCPYCETNLIDGHLQWVVEDIRLFSGFSRVDEIKPDTSYSRLTLERFLVAAIQAMLADGIVARSEELAIHSLAKKHGYPAKNVNALIKSVVKGRIKYSLSSQPQENRTILIGVIYICLIDGNISEEEQRFIDELATNLGFDNELDMKLLVNEAKRMIYQENDAKQQHY